MDESRRTTERANTATPGARDGLQGYHRPMDITGGRILGWHVRVLDPERHREEAVVARVLAPRAAQGVIEVWIGRAACGTRPCQAAHHRDLDTVGNGP